MREDTNLVRLEDTSGTLPRLSKRVIFADQIEVKMITFNEWCGLRSRRVSNCSFCFVCSTSAPHLLNNEPHNEGVAHCESSLFNNEGIGAHCSNNKPNNEPPARFR